MAYDEELADRLRETLQDVSGVTEKRMFGGLAFMVSGNMAVAAGSQGALMVRVDPSFSEELGSRPHASRMVMRGKEMNGWLTVDADGLRTDPDLASWVETALSYAQSLPTK
ncbi:TfoX/Sxy family protein [Lapillicoccus sp.]|uniref:TfoX/Sxy family protein n=1 Tax=Lapillicoccus sp. TaxID=1909287 RepID=UPI003264EB4E